jgi:EAL domain-containing protein (putative c-di-GMP-specific phosphodiesterase class I)
MDSDLRQAIIQNEFQMAYQPQIELKTDTICAAEALVRWHHPIKGLIPPNEFISLAEKSDLIVSLNEHIMRLVFQQIGSDWQGPPISINISARQFQNGFRLVEYIEIIMKEFAINPKYIELEITENMLLKNTEHNLAVLSAINNLGFEIAIDDFGSGFSSFGYVTRLPVHKIKIDKTFITGLPDNVNNCKIVAAIIRMSQSLDKIALAEGAETKAEVDFLRQNNCDMVQGFYYHKPMSFDELKKHVAENKPINS